MAREDPPARPDAWSRWFPRVMQVVGLAMAGYEGFVSHLDRPYMFGASMVMMAGGVGWKQITDWLGRR